MDVIDESMFDIVFFKQKTAYEMRIRDWSSDVCSSDLARPCVPQIVPAEILDPASLQRRTPFARVRRTERIAPIGEHMGRMLAPLALQHGKRDLVERHAERAAVLRVAMPDRGHAAGHIDPVPCTIENVDLQKTRLTGEQTH